MNIANLFACHLAMATGSAGGQVAGAISPAASLALGVKRLATKTHLLSNDFISRLSQNPAALFMQIRWAKCIEQAWNHHAAQSSKAAGAPPWQV
jgi:hypothetical protein